MVYKYELALGEEVAGWEEARLRLFNKTQSVKVRDRDAASKFRKALGVDIWEWFWGWLDAAEMSEAGDRWSLYLGCSDGLWSAATLPTQWTGKLYGAFLADQGEEMLVVGRCWDTGREDGGGFWASLGEPVDVPLWPALGKGVGADRAAGEMRLLGVLRRLHLGKMDQISSGETSGGDFAIAWGDKEGEFLGWELIGSMGAVREIAPNQIRRVEPLANWEGLEIELRRDSRGFEI